MRGSTYVIIDTLLSWTVPRRNSFRPPCGSRFSFAGIHVVSEIASGCARDPMLPPALAILNEAFVWHQRRRIRLRNNRSKSPIDLIRKTDQNERRILFK